MSAGTSVSTTSNSSFSSAASSPPPAAAPPATAIATGALLASTPNVSSDLRNEFAGLDEGQALDVLEDGVDRRVHAHGRRSCGRGHEPGDGDGGGDEEALHFFCWFFTGLVPVFGLR